MPQVYAVWESLPLQRKLVAVLAVLAILVAVVGLARLASTPPMSLLYSGLDDMASGEIVTALEQQGVAYELRGNAIYVDSGVRDRARLTLAASGLPANGPAGYEILETMSGFGTTSQMFEATYWRAKEGELARTILVSTEISKARVHIAQASDQPFRRETPVSASVTVTARNGQITREKALAIRHLVASAVAGLDPDRVAVIDARAGIILAPGDSSSSMSNSADGDALAATLRENVTRLLEARVGAGNAVVEVSVDVNTESQTISERLLDPEASVLVSSETETRTENANGTTGGTVTVASNLPDGEAADGGGQSTRNNKQSREISNFEFSETLRETVKGSGAVERLSVAVLLNDLPLEGATTPAKRSAEEVAALLGLVRSAVGYDEARGDVVTIETMPLAVAPPLGTEISEGNGWLSAALPMLAQLGILGAVVLALGLFVVRPVLAPRELPEMKTIGGSDTSAEGTPTGDASKLAAQAQPALAPPEANAIDLLRETVNSRSEDSSTLLRNWIEATEIPEKAEA